MQRTVQQQNKGKDSGTKQGNEQFLFQNGSCLQFFLKQVSVMQGTACTGVVFCSVLSGFILSSSVLHYHGVMGGEWRELSGEQETIFGKNGLLCL